DEALLERHPALASIGALTWAMTGRADTAERWADAADRGAAKARARRKASGTAWQALLHSLMSPRGADEMCADAERAVGSLPLGSEWRAPALLVLGSAHALAGDRERADAVLDEAGDTAASSGAPAVQAAVLAYQSPLAADRGE